MLKKSVEEKSGAAVSPEGETTTTCPISKETHNSLLEIFTGNHTALDKIFLALKETNRESDLWESEMQRWLESCKIFETCFDESLPDNSSAAQALALFKSGDFKGAEEFLRKSLGIHVALEEKGKHSAASDAFALGFVKELLFDYQEARVFYEKAARLNPQNGAYLNQYGSLLTCLGEYHKAIEYFTRAIERIKAVSGEKHARVADGYYRLGNSWKELGNIKKAIEYFTKALEIDLDIYGEKHLNVAKRYDALGSAWKTTDDAREAIDYYTKALEIYLDIYGEKHPSVATTYNNLGLVWFALGHARYTKDFLSKALRIDVEIYGEKHPNVAKDYNNLGGMWKTLGDTRKAIESYTKALKIFNDLYGSGHSYTKTVQSNIDYVKGKK
ncbi:MAG: tetratricopeptide repeat protein [Candidatus Brocadiaceae bacterium]|nr:tetratricopeptide repeat protein [Candidatus Brocadiaceae bacterium]